MKHTYKRNLALSALALSSFFFMNYSGGAANSGQRLTGAPFDNGTCSNCHSGGSYSATVALQLLDATNTAVTSYVPGANYTLRINRTATGLPANGGFGFQLTAATTPGNVNNNTWGATLPANVAKRTASARQYIEQTTKISGGVTTLDIPWTAPSTNVGSLKFYIALNTVNGNSSTGGDQVVTSTLTINANPLPVSWLYFNGITKAEGALLEWGVAQEENNAYYTLERSEDGKHFSPVARLDAKHLSDGEQHYSYMDLNFKAINYYRISQTDFGGATSYFKTIQLNRQGGNDFIAHHTITATDVLIQAQAAQAGNAICHIYGIDGRVITTRIFDLAAGSNSLSVSRPDVPGLYLIAISACGKLVYQDKFVVSQ